MIITLTLMVYVTQFSKGISHVASIQACLCIYELSLFEIVNNLSINISKNATTFKIRFVEVTFMQQSLHSPACDSKLLTNSYRSIYLANRLKVNLYKRCSKCPRVSEFSIYSKYSKYSRSASLFSFSIT